MPDDSSHDDFDWVAAQAACTAETMFPRLLAGVRRDVERRNALTNRADQFHFQVVEDEDEDRFDVIRTIGAPTDTTHVHASVTFERIGSRINVQGDHVDVDVTAVVGINPSGTCRFFVAEAEYTEWEMRKLALDQLFFAEIEE